MSLVQDVLDTEEGRVYGYGDGDSEAKRREQVKIINEPFRRACDSRFLLRGARAKVVGGGSRNCARGEGLFRCDAICGYCGEKEKTSLVAAWSEEGSGKK